MISSLTSSYSPSLLRNSQGALIPTAPSPTCSWTTASNIAEKYLARESSSTHLTECTRSWTPACPPHRCSEVLEWYLHDFGNYPQEARHRHQVLKGWENASGVWWQPEDALAQRNHAGEECCGRLRVRNNLSHVESSQHWRWRYSFRSTFNSIFFINSSLLSWESRAHQTPISNFNIRL